MKTFENYLRRGWKGIFLALLFLPFMISAQPTEEEIQQSIDDGVAWLVTQQNASGYWMGYYSAEAGTGLALYKLCERAYELGYESPFDAEYEYHQNIIDGFDWLFDQLQVHAIGTQDHTTGATGTVDDPDVNGNTTGVCCSYGTTRESYYTGILLTAIAASGTPDRLVDVATSPVNGWTYADVAQDMVDFLAWSQVEYPVPGITKEGGWDYFHVDNGVGGSSWKGDQSNSGYVVLGLAEAEAFGATIPQWVKDELSVWVDYVQDDVNGDANDGGSWYSYPGDYILVNTLKTGNLLTQMALCGDTPETQRVLDAVNYLINHWYDAGGGNTPPGWNGIPYGNNPAQYQAMFCIMKGLVFMGIDEIDGIDWFVDFATVIVSQQSASGAWLASSGRSEPVIVTEWALLTLEKIAPPPPVVYVDLDVHPTSWPNPINVASSGKTPMAILGTEEFDVYTIDPSTLYLDLPEGMVYPLTWAYEDVTMPAGNEWECNDTEEGPDGYMDLTLKFNTQEIVAALGDVSDGDELVIVIRGMLMDEQNLEGDDCIRIIDNTDKDVVAGIHGQLSQNYPNPFSHMTAIHFMLDEPSHVTLKVYDLLGNEVAVLADRYYAAGTHRVEFEPVNLSGGMYIYRLQTDDGMATMRMLYHQ